MTTSRASTRCFALIFAVSFVVIGAACSSSGSTAKPAGETPAAQAPDPRTVEEFLAQDAKPAELLRAFATVFGAVPGVKPLDLEPGTGTRTALVTAVRANFKQYTPEQQKAVAQLANPKGDAHKVTGPAGGSGKSRAQINNADADRLVGRAIGQLETRTGFDYTRPISVQVLLREEVEHDTWAEAIVHEPGTPFIGLTPWSQDGPSASAECVVFIGQAVSSAGDDVAYEKIAHEIFHCFQYAAYSGSITEFGALPKWLVEGGAAWAGLEISGGHRNTQSDTWWAAYFNNPEGEGARYSLQAGSGYHALGFFSFLAGAGTDVWRALIPALNAGTPGRSFAQITGDNADTLAAWASSSARTGWSSAWSMSGPAIIDAHREGDAIPVQNGTQEERSIPNLTTQVMKVQVGDDADYMIVSMAGPTTASWNGEADMKITGSEVVRYCFMDECACPDGEPPFGGAAFTQHDPGSLTIGNSTTSALAGGNVHVLGVSKEDACRCEEGSGGGGSGRARPKFMKQTEGSCDYDPCLTGTWIADNGVMLRLLNVRAGGRYRNATGRTTLTFAPPRATVNYGQTFTAHIDAGITLTAKFHGRTSIAYRAVAGQLTSIPPVTPGGRIKFTVSAAGMSRSTENPFEGIGTGDVAQRYQCNERDLTISAPIGEVVWHKAR